LASALSFETNGVFAFILITEIAIAIEFGANAEDVAHTGHPHPHSRKQ
jgi:pyruvate/2-oxoglutarate dehydrogenase complex dihydrolipoamide dehydrogenase (E3) component